MSTDLEARLSAAQTRYLPRLKEAAVVLADQIATHKSSQSTEDLEAIRKTVHRLAGAAGSFGFADISAAALTADVEAKALIAAGGDATRLHDLTSALVELLRRTHDA